MRQTSWTRGAVLIAAVVVLAAGCTGTPESVAAPTTTPAPTTTAPAKFTSITASGNHSCGVRSDGTATCWGENYDGQADAPS